MEDLHVAVVMPAYDEEAIGEFVDGVCDELVAHVGRLSVVVVDDASPTPVTHVLSARRDCSVRVLRHLGNLGHGPSVLDAYRAGVDTGADVVVHVDGDGQVDPRSVIGLARVAHEAGIVIGQRVGRDDPWFRRVLTCVAGRCLAGRGRLPDSNCPARAFRSAPLRLILAHLPQRAMVPHLLMNVVLVDLGLPVRTLTIQDRPRRGTSEVGTTWRPRRLRALPPAGLARFAARAWLEVAAFRARGPVQGEARPAPQLVA